MKKAVIYLRVSDPSQIENNSLQTQEKICRSFATRQGFDLITSPFRDEGFSAKGKGYETRPNLRGLIDFCKNKKNNISTVIVYKMDRWSRDVKDGLAIISLLSKYGIDVVSATEGFQDDAQGRFMRTILLATAQLDNELKGERVKDNMQTMFRSGLWCWKPPIGYKRPFNNKFDNRGKTPIINLEIGLIIKHIFELASTGIYSRKQLADEANLLGFENLYHRKMDHKLVVSILKNSFYYGLMYAPKWNEYQMGIHEPLISENLWQLANAKVFGIKRKYSIQDTSEYPLKGFIHCGICKGFMTSSNPSGRNAKKYKHYECGNKKCRKTRINIEEAHEQFISRLSALKPSEEVLRLFNHMVKEEWDMTLNKTQEREELIESNIKKLQNEIDSISKSFNIGVYTPEEAKEKAEKIRSEIAILSLERSDNQIVHYNAEIVTNFITHFLKHLDSLWNKLDLPKKQALQNIIFINGIECTIGKEIRTGDLSLAFQVILAIDAKDSALVTLG